MQGILEAQSVETKTDSRTRLFMSYSRKDLAFAEKVEAALKARGFEVLIDREEIYAFEDWWKRIQGLIGGADTVVFVLSPDAVKSDVALKEVGYAASLNKRFAPIVCRRVDDAAVPEALRRLNFIFFDDPAQFEVSIKLLDEALQTDIAWVRRHTEFGDIAHRWVRAGRPNGMLLRPPVLDQAEAWLTFRQAGAPAPTAETEAFIAQSRNAMLRTRRIRRFVEGCIFLLMSTVIVGLVGWINQSRILDEWRFLTVTWPYERANVWPYVLTPLMERVLKPGQSFKECAQDCPEMIVVPAGSFTMGASARESQVSGYSLAVPQHTVTFAKPFAVSKYELTFADWDACVAGGGCGNYAPRDANWGRGRQPVIMVSWDDAQLYVSWLSEVTGKTYRLLSEAEYQYAARAGTLTTYPWGDDIKLDGKVMANCSGCGSQWDLNRTAPVGSFAPNKFGLYDMVGNVVEWVEDCSHANFEGAPTDGSAWLAGSDCSLRVTVGGSWGTAPEFVRSAWRGALTSNSRLPFIGFRVARTLLVP